MRGSRQQPRTTKVSKILISRKIGRDVSFVHAVGDWCLYDSHRAVDSEAEPTLEEAVPAASAAQQSEAGSTMQEEEEEPAAAARQSEAERAERASSSSPRFRFGRILMMYSEASGGSGEVVRVVIAPGMDPHSEAPAAPTPYGRVRVLEHTPIADGGASVVLHTDTVSAASILAKTYVCVFLPEEIPSDGSKSPHASLADALREEARGGRARERRAVSGSRKRSRPAPAGRRNGGVARGGKSKRRRELGRQEQFTGRNDANGDEGGAGAQSPTTERLDSAVLAIVVPGAIHSRATQ